MTNDNFLTDERELDPKTLIIKLNDKLVSSGAGNAELAFGLGCAIAIVPIGILLLIAYMLGVRNWIGLGLIALIGGLLATAIATFLASRARTGAIKQAYHHEIEPRILQYLKVHELDLEIFQQTAEQALPANAPIMRYLASTQPDMDFQEE